MSEIRNSWSAEKARAWGESMPLLTGANYLPRTAINQLEMWQDATWAPDVINEELGWAASLGFNSMRVFLHDLMWALDPAAFLTRIDEFLTIAARHEIGVMLVLFDSCWHPFPYLGAQREPEPGVHNSGWLQSPGVAVLRDSARFDLLEDYVRGVVRHFKNDPRVQVWDIWNEPDNSNSASYGVRDLAQQKSEIVRPLLEKAFGWARAENPDQPLTSGIWWGNWSADERLNPMEQVQIAQSDVISFHNYETAEKLEERIRQLQRFERPLLCTEYMARGPGSTFEGSLPVLLKHRVAAYNWGFVAGRSQTYFAWDSWQNPYPPEPPLWFHDIFRPDGTPYRPEEASFLRSSLKQNDTQ